MSNITTTFTSNITTTSTTIKPDICNDEYIICLEFIGGDYIQVLQISLIIFLMQLGLYIIVYPFYSKFLGGGKLEMFMGPEGLPDLSHVINKSAKNKVTDTNYVGHNPKWLFLLLSALNIILYFVIKIILYIDLLNDDIIQEYKAVGFKKFITASSICQVGIFTHNIVSSMIILPVGNDSKASGFIFFLYKLCQLIFVADIIGSIVLLCILWPLLLVGLYLIAVTLLVLIMVIICSICILIVLLIVVLIFYALGFGVGYLLTFGDISKPFYDYVMSLMISIPVIALLFFIRSLIYTFMFLFIGGPIGEFVVLDFNSGTSHYDILVLFSLTVGIGLFSLAVGFVISCIQGLSSEQTQKGDHNRVSTQELVAP